MFIKGVKPRTHLAIDLLLFTLLLAIGFSALMEHTLGRAGAHIGFMFHALHGIAGFGMYLVVGLHLLLHLPWIRSQLSRLLKSLN